MMDRELMMKYETFVANEFEKIIGRGDMTPQEVSNLETAMCLLEKLKKHIKGDEEEASYRGGYYRGSGAWVSPTGTNANPSVDWAYNNGSYTQPNSRQSNRSYGAYESNGSMEDKIRSLEAMRNEATNETERRMIDEWIMRLRSERH